MLLPPPYSAAQPICKPEDLKEVAKPYTEDSNLTASQKLFKQKQLKAPQPGDTEESAIILLDDSEDDVEFPIKFMVSFVADVKLKSCSPLPFYLTGSILLII